MKKLKSNFIMFLVLIAYMAIVISIFIKTAPSKVALLIGIPISFIYAMVCFFNKRIRSTMTIWWGILSLATCVLWIYLMTK
jgi:predicted nucleic acid-binding Zn ribbon protein